MKVPKKRTINFGLVDTARLEGLFVYLGDDYFTFGLVDTVRLEGLFVYLGDDYSAFGLVDTIRLKGLFIYHDDDYLAIGLVDTVRPNGLHHKSRTRGAMAGPWRTSMTWWTSLARCS
jgi:hypothetical protein